MTTRSSVSWVAVVTPAAVVNYRLKGSGKTLCSSVLRPTIDRLGPMGRPATAGLLVWLYLHLTRRR